MVEAHFMLETLRNRGFKLTPQRIAIVRELAGDERHPTAQDLFDRLAGAFPTMSFATVYNTLDTLEQLGLVSSLRLGSAVRYDPNAAPHHHIVCDACGSVSDVPPAHPLPTLGDRARLERDYGFFVRTEERTFRGTCRSCHGRSSSISSR